MESNFFATEPVVHVTTSLRQSNSPNSNSQVRLSPAQQQGTRTRGKENDIRNWKRAGRSDRSRSTSGERKPGPPLRFTPHNGRTEQHRRLSPMQLAVHNCLVTDNDDIERLTSLSSVTYLTSVAAPPVTAQPHALHNSYLQEGSRHAVAPSSPSPDRSPDDLEPSPSPCWGDGSGSIAGSDFTSITSRMHRLQTQHHHHHHQQHGQRTAEKVCPHLESTNMQRAEHSQSPVPLSPTLDHSSVTKKAATAAVIGLPATPTRRQLLEIGDLTPQQWRESFRHDWGSVSKHYKRMSCRIDAVVNQAEKENEMNRSAVAAAPVVDHPPTCTCKTCREVAWGIVTEDDDEKPREGEAACDDRCGELEREWL